MKGLYTILLLLASNTFMTLAWYGHLRVKEFEWGRGLGLFSIILISWGIAFFEDCRAVPAHRIGARTYSLAELKTIQEVLSLATFVLVAWMLFAGWGLTAALLIVTRNAPQASFRNGLRESGRYLLQALPFAAIIFILFPRIPGPLWGMPSSSSTAESGLDDSMTPGSISKLVLSDKMAFRVRFEGDLPPSGERYWRGPTLHLFNGRTWIQGFVPVEDTERVDNTSRPVKYTVMLEPHQRNWLYALTVPVSYPDDAALTRDFQLATRSVYGTMSEAQVDLILNLESRTDKVQDNFWDGYDWTERLGDAYVGQANQVMDTIQELQRKARLIRITPAGVRESHVHDVTITKEAPNYRSE